MSRIESTPEEVMWRMIFAGATALGGAIFGRVYRTKVDIQQTYLVANLDDGFPHDWVRDRIDHDFGITLIAASDSEIFIVMTKGVNKRSIVHVSQEYPTRWLEDRYKKGYRPVALDGGGDRWFAAMNKELPAARFVIPKIDTQEFSDLMNQKLIGGGFVVRSLGGGAQGWTGIGSERFNPLARDYFHHSVGWPQDWIKWQYDQGRRLNAVGGRNGEWVVSARWNSMISEESRCFPSGLDCDWVDEVLSNGQVITAAGSDGVGWALVARGVL